MINLQDKHAAIIDELFTKNSITEDAVNDDFDWTGVNTIHLHSVPAVPMNNYVRTGSNRYGTPSELQDNVQDMVCGQDRSFTFTIDKGNSEEDSALKSGNAVERQVKLVIIPEIDSYRLAVIAAGAKSTAAVVLSKTNVYEKFLDLNAILDDEKVPDADRLCYLSSSAYKYLKQDGNFILASDLAQEMKIKGQIGEVDGVRIMKGSGRLPVGVDMLFCHKVATTSPRKLSEVKTHQDPPGISGQLVEGREIYDAIVLGNKTGALAVHRGSLMPLTVTNAAGAVGKTKFTAVTGYTGQNGVVMGTLVYVIGAAPETIALGTDISDIASYPALTLNTDIAADAANKYIIALKDQNGLCIGTSGTAVACAIGE